MEDNKKDVKILSDEELEGVAGGICPRVPPQTWQTTSSQRCPRYKDEKSCTANIRIDPYNNSRIWRWAQCGWIDGKCVSVELL